MCSNTPQNNALSYKKIIALMGFYLLFIIIIFIITFIALKGMGFSDSREQSVITVLAAIIGSIVSIAIDRFLKLLGQDQ
jgi:hypothetical protein